MEITGVETFAVNTGFTRPPPWLFCAVRTDAGLTGYGEFGSDGVTRGHMRIPIAPGRGTDLNETTGRRHAFTG